MLKKTIKYEDYNGVEREEDFYFHFTEAEISEMEMSVDGGYSEMLQGIVKAKSVPEAMKVFKNIILKAYGEKSPDGRRFIKSEELSTAFSQTEAYSVLFMELTKSEEAMAAFVSGLLPAKIAKAMAEEEAKLKVAPALPSAE